MDGWLASNFLDRDHRIFLLQEGVSRTQECELYWTMTHVSFQDVQLFGIFLFRALLKGYHLLGTKPHPAPKIQTAPWKWGFCSMTWTRHPVRWFLCWTVEWFELNGLPHDLGCQMTWNSKCAQNGREIIKLRTWNDWQMFETSEEMRRGEMVEMMISDFTGWKAEHKWLISELSPKCCDATS